MDYLYGEGVCIVEWSERLESLLPADHLRVTFHYEGFERRRIIVETTGSLPGDSVVTLAKAYKGR
jgi:tRNA threonylcarbamoyladenosine biosynthesis protein TsaE